MFYFWRGATAALVPRFLCQSGRRRPENVSILSSLFSGRRQLQPDVTSGFVQYCACSCSPHCRRAPVGDGKLVCLALWREREYLTFISIRLVAFSNQNWQIIVRKWSLFSLSHISSSISKLCYLHLHLYNVSMFHVTESRSNMAKKSIQTKNMNFDILIVGF